jgi:hypothetical protein
MQEKKTKNKVTFGSLFEIKWKFVNEFEIKFNGEIYGSESRFKN